MTDTTERSGFVYIHKLLKQLLILLLCTVLIGTGFAPRFGLCSLTACNDQQL